ncbi:hypothetical protein [Kitasatospora sp. GP82]|uniref:hypothetical protein n=1 Tax=Kitasatospora sp. GP82 TaxID=3035089 RepID=UPI0024751A3E|nr:hypothetical protein [Kitasatospora sp. GP82]MDH6124559.1 hypothetical protein [Kitasatospora sp. GP82]
MSAHRPLVAAALLATTVLSLAACGAGSTTSTAAASASPAVATSPSASATVPQQSSATPAISHTATAHPSAPGKPAQGTPAADCTTAAQRPGHRVVNVVSGTAGSSEIAATATKFICGPNVDDDGYYQPAGSPTTFKIASGAQGELFTLGNTTATRGVPVAQLIQHADDCGHHRPVDRPYSCFGGNYDITVDVAGHITHISELYHP